ncbi:peptidoglycan/xylan/chitin deacetylase (PgdA/CDA1 family) [Murinocardiopsis flavida]|uniref:Peptidoglycan/xylan/chitin deacetylase (PgdA/CDA1 family) n=1 Tax=Murinocardiopsis flavida TaxID=645275 RepID=A0A2P8DH11_9ACTN|nr:polysaccharide deacetylase family protein [Murinocardiopsis flavida]PSK96459.1 peptidoglycan/xylan/chitin deacetylase (PgdA/CDA1 family) [Murinocardiopsis flavida]
MRAVVATAAVAAMIGGCSSGGGAEHASGKDTEPVRATGEPDKLTKVAPKTVPGVKAEENKDDGDVDVDVRYPDVPNAAPFTKRLDELTSQEVDDFKAANPGAESIAIDYGITAAGDDVLGVRLTSDEKDSEGKRKGSATYWYDAKAGRTAYSTELLSGQKDLAALNKLVKKELKGEDAVDSASIVPILRVYDSIGFNPDGDLVVEFDEGQVAPVKSGRVKAIVPKKKAEPLLSKFGARAQDAATVVTPKFRITKEASAAPSPEAPAAAKVPGVLPTRDGDLDCSLKKSKCVALTFDDGPGGRTGDLLDMLAKHDAKATFFLTGEPVREFAPLVRREYAEGHEVANHTVTHPDLTTVSASSAEGELATVNALIRRETGFQPSLMRPPYGATDKSVAKASADNGLAEIIWSSDTNDWRDRDSSVVAKRAVADAKPGAIILMHDIHPSTVDAVPEILKKLTDDGYNLVTVTQMLGDTKPGKSYKEGEIAKEKEEPSASASPSASESGSPSPSGTATSGKPEESDKESGQPEKDDKDAQKDEKDGEKE